MTKVLILEDSMDINEMLLRAFDHHGIAAKAAEDWRSFAVSLLENPPQAIVLDIHLSNDHSGYWVLEKLRELGVTVPVIVSSAFVGNDAARTLMRDFGCKYLCKPYDPQRLIELIKSEIAARELLHATPKDRENHSGDNWTS